MSKPFKPTKKEIKKKIEDAIVLLNDIVCIKLAPSPIHGIGVFAVRNIKKGEKIYPDAIPHAFDVPYKEFYKLNPEVRDILLGHYPVIVKGSNFLYPVTRFICFINHSSDANYDAKKDEALRDIKKGEEVTEDYRLIEGYKKVFTFIK